jgi:hypothetical protein
MLTQARLKELYHYNPETGLFTRLCDSIQYKAGTVVQSRTSDGYLYTWIDRKQYKLHHLAWLYIYGTIPTENIDHINRSRRDNRIANLRLADKSENSCNARKRIDNSSGWRGVYWHQKASKWVAQIQKETFGMYIGLFTCPLDAASAFNLAAYQLHGEHASYNEPDGEAIVFA